ncbi:MAG: alpha-L-fucosidase [Defluviitaleaceae bacterium]|nr:alpha-L-fucosidase [Defluviitaleaceae bacterium]
MGNWINSAGVGLFVHWGINTGNANWHKGETLYKTFEEFEDAVNRAGWAPEKWVNAARKIRASYITMAIFHSCLGYIKAWKSDIPGTYSTKRDFLGELIAEAKKHDIRVVLYISGDTTGYLRHPSQPWIFPDEYKTYKNDNSINILDDRHWQQFYSKDIIEEAIHNYPDLAGFWFDGWNNPDTNAEIFGFIHKKNPALLNFRNNFASASDPHEDIMSLESFNKVLDPPFDFASGAWANPGGREYCFTIPELSDWFQCYPPAEDYDKKSALRKFVSIRTNNWSAKIGLGPNIGGDFNGSLGEYINDLDNLLTWAGESLLNITPGVIPSGYMNDGAYIATSQNDRSVYIHTLLPPKAGTLTIADGGQTYGKAINLKTGKPVAYTQENGQLQITCDFNSYCEEDGDTIIKLSKKADRTGPPIKLNSQPLPADIIIETKGPTHGLLIHQDDSSATTRGGWAYVENNRARNFTLFTSEDGLNYNLHITGSLSGSRGMKQINFRETKSPYIKLRIETAYDTTPGYVKKFSNGFWEYPQISPESLTPQNELTVGGQKHICMEDGTVRVWGAEGNNKYIIGTGAKGIAADTDGKLLAIVPQRTGKLVFTQISTINR